MAIRILVVDDSSFFQKRIREILKPDPDIEIIGFADNGREAIDKVQSLSPDVITLDYEMPVMDGLTALRNIMNIRPTPVLMFSSLTYDGARVTLDALDAGAVDYLPKNFEDLQRGGDRIRSILSQKIKDVARQYNGRAARAVSQISTATSPAAKLEAKPDKPATKPEVEKKPEAAKPTSRSQPKPVEKKTAAPQADKPAARTRPKYDPSPVAAGPNKSLSHNVDLVVIGTSTGGPVALQKVLSDLPHSFNKPIVLVQHMPASFTAAFAERLDKLCAIGVKLAEDGDPLKPGQALLAPGGKQLMIDRGRVKVIDGDERLNYKPSVDIALASAAKHYPGKTLAVILTGMGSDGCDGSRLVKQTGGTIWAQDKDTSVIYGMPMAVAKAGYTDAILPLQEVALKMVKEVR